MSVVHSTETTRQFMYDDNPLTAPLTSRPHPPRSGSTRPRHSATTSREGSVMSTFVDLPDLNLERDEPLEDEESSTFTRRRRRDSATPEVVPETNSTKPKRRKVREDPVLVENSPSEKLKGKQPAKQADGSGPRPEITSYSAPSPQRPETSPTTEPLSAYTCPICFGPPTYATLTPCGHVCCGECLFAAVNAATQRARYTGIANRIEAKCPVCRATLPGWDGRGGGIIGLRPRAVFAL